ncbi:hypothetical protein FHR24_003039 [Wenyingzhuangia heitensis]|uniref:Uncharacterized protein n=1 Tax=Wenyingzhuangia heitensis TaxID=1487859 RepID=A0ABX0UFA1_9FLAO|nr:hypothetical protein [Wenyingzhuangia heitensis]NIJ46550.1 hypothetical protein [Wenyingzhuangia heitensis]
MKIAGLHALIHIDDEHEEQCVVCEYAISYNLIPILSPDVEDFSVENTDLVVCEKKTIDYIFSFLTTITTDQLFSRPPPFLL